jgi:hypothetical protein
MLNMILYYANHSQKDAFCFLCLDIKINASFHTWTAVFLAPLVISFHDFLVLFFFFILDAPLVYSMCILLCFAFLLIFLLLIKK